MRTDPMLASVVATLALLPVAAQGQTMPPPAPPVTVPIGSPDQPLAGVLLRPETALSCDGRTVSRIDGESLPPTLYGRTYGAQTGQRIGRAIHTFGIDETGRVLNIRAQGATSDDDGPFVTLTPAVQSAVQATLAGWRFAPEARPDCRLTIRYVPVPVASADRDMLMRFFAVTRYSGAERQAVQRRLAGPDHDCEEAGPFARAGYPNFEAGRRRPGIEDWTVVTWNVAADGAIKDVQTLASSGDAGFDTEARDATSRSRARPGKPRTGCVYNWYRRGSPLAAPAMPTPPTDPLADCPAAVLSGIRPRLTARGPEAFLSRGVEGWALVRFDIAPWGQIGNVAVVDAQPAQAFGDAAMAAFQGATADPGPGATRCLQPVHYRIQAED